jgi:hypothetical protein
MSTSSRRIWVLLVLGAVLAAVVLRRRRTVAVPAVPPEWPPLPPRTVEPVPTAEPLTVAAAAAWVAALRGGTMPEGYPVKVKAASGIYHVPGGRFYDRTIPDRWYATAEAAEADGYRRSKN